jgi:DNA-binding response OmpR family regulator
MPVKSNLAFVIEADADLLGRCENALKSVGFEVEAFADGKAAYERLALEPAPRLVLVDLQLPNVSGHEITWEMWFNLDDSRIIVIAPDQKSAAIYENRAGVDRVLTKPFTADEIRKIARPYLNPAYSG